MGRNTICVGWTEEWYDIAILCKDAQRRIEELHLDIDQVFSLRLTETLRIYGILENGVFNVLWYDPNHEICPAVKR